MTTKTEMLKNVRLFCSECMGGKKAKYNKLPIDNPADVASCTAPECVWFDFRMGNDPNPSEARVEMGKRLGQTLTVGR